MPILTADDVVAGRMSAQLERAFVGANGVNVQQSDDSVIIGLGALRQILASMPFGAEPVKLALAGGVEGGVGTQCTFRYDLHRASAATLTTDTRMASNVLPYRPRPTIGKYVAAPFGSFGLAMRIAGTWLLLEVYQEVPFVEACP